MLNIAGPYKVRHIPPAPFIFQYPLFGRLIIQTKCWDGAMTSSHIMHDVSKISQGLTPATIKTKTYTDMREKDIRLHFGVLTTASLWRGIMTQDLH